MTLFDPPQPLPAAPIGPLVRVRMTVAYDGAGFHGFAAQAAGVPTVAGALAGALERVLRLTGPPAITCAGRTDAGVHAWGQTAHVDLPVGVDVDDLRRRLVKLLAPQIVVRSLDLAPPGWDARRSARSRSYRYMVLNRALPDPFWHGRVWHVEQPLDRRAMELACDPLIGERDFSSFCRRPTGEPAASLTRNVTYAGWVDGGDGIVRFDITATAFCHQMVRSIVGTLVDVGLGRRRAGEMVGILQARDRSAAGSVAPPEGLCLWSVGYPDDLEG